MQFVFQPLAWGFLLVLIPLIIHLINLVRHRKTQWAAMEFLLESYRKHRRWVWLKQALLIASRMLAIAILVAMLAQWVSGSRWLAMISQSTVHHYIVLDDSASMGDSANGVSAYQSALNAIQSIANSANNREGTHLLSIIRSSRAIRNSSASTNSNDNPTSDKTIPADATKTSGAATAGTAAAANDPSKASSPTVDAVADMLARTIPSDPSALLAKINSTQPTFLDNGLNDSIDLVGPMIAQSTSEKAIVYLMSDFRQKDWANAATVKQQLLALPGNETEIQLVDCVSNRHENLTLVSVQPQQEVLAAGVPAMINISVRNNGIAPVQNVTVRVYAIDYGSPDIESKSNQKYSGITTELPPLLIDSIKPGELVTRYVQVLFPKSGSHVIEAELPADSIAADNNARCVLDLNEGLRVLLIDGDLGGKHSFFFESALNPGGATKTGLVMTREGPEFLRDSDSIALRNYACIILQAVPSLDVRALENLHRYVSQGGGLAILFGDSLSTADYIRYNALWSKPLAGASNPVPLIPFELSGPVDLPKKPGDTNPDLIPESHPIFAPLLGLSNSPFQFVRIQKYVELAKPSLDKSTPKLESQWKAVASLRDGQPLIVDHPIGEGRVVIGLTALDRKWTNWPQDPTFVVAALKLVGYLSSFKLPETARTAGTPMRWDFSSQEMHPEIEVLCPANAPNGIRAQLTINAVPSGDSAFKATLTNESNVASDDFVRTIMSAGNFEWWGTSTSGDRVVKNIARNTPPVEGDTEKILPSDLSRELSGVKYTYRAADSLGSNTSLAGFANRNMLLMVLLLALLMFEQWLAWSASYHVVAKR